MTSSSLWAACASLAIALAPFAAHAAEGEKPGVKELVIAKEAYDSAEFEKAITYLKEALDKTPQQDRAQRIEIFKYLGQASLAQGKNLGAEEAFRNLLREDPDHQLNPLLTSPKIVEFFNAVKAQIRKEGKVTVKHTAPESFRAGDTLELTAYAFDPNKKIARMDVFYRVKDETKDFARSAEAQRAPGDDTRWTAIVPWTFGERSSSFVIEYYVAAKDGTGEWVGTSGEPREPHDVEIKVIGGTYVPPDPTPFYQKWWFWTGVGVLAAGGGAAVWYLQPEPAPPATGAAVIVIR